MAVHLLLGGLENEKKLLGYDGEGVNDKCHGQHFGQSMKRKMVAMHDSRVNEIWILWGKSTMRGSTNEFDFFPKSQTHTQKNAALY